MYKNIVKYFAVICMMVGMIFPINVHAMNVFITPNTYEAEVGDKITYTITVEDGEGTINIDGQEVEVEGDEEYVFERSYSAPGKYRFEVFTDQSTLDYIVVTILEEGTLEEDLPTNDDEPSSDSHLKSLVVKDTNGDEIRVGFASTQTSYTIDLTDEDTEITIEAVARDEQHAQIQGNGVKTILPGYNKFEIIVTAQDSSKTTYTLNVNVEVTPVTYLSYEGKDYGLMEELTNISIPDGFKKTKTTINNENVTIYTNSHILLVYGYDEDKNGQFFIYREDDGIVAPYNPLRIDTTKIYLVDVPEELKNREAMTFKTITIQDTEIDAWVFDDENLVDYVLIYALNSEGEADYFVYDGKTQQLMEYPNSEPVTQKDFEKWLNNESNVGTYLLYGSIAVVVLVIIGVGFWIFKKGKKDDDDQDEPMTVEGTKEFVIPEKKAVVETGLQTMKKEETFRRNLPPITNEDNDDEWLTDHFYKTIMGDDDD